MSGWSSQPAGIKGGHQREDGLFRSVGGRGGKVGGRGGGGGGNWQMTSGGRLYVIGLNLSLWGWFRVEGGVYIGQ